MTLQRALHAETLKMKRTIALKMVVLAPAAVVLLTLFMASQAPFSTLHRSGSDNDWRTFARVNLQFWALLMMPLYVTLQTALIAGLDHSDHQWKALLARPVPRWTLYVAKLLVVMSMTAVSSILLLCGVLAAGAVLGRLLAEARFGSPIPLADMMQQVAQVTGLGFLALSIQHWVSLRWRSFSIAVGVGIVALVTSFAMLLSSAQQYHGWPRYFPWSLPMLVLERRPANVEATLWISGVIGLAVCCAGCAEFCKREVM